MVMVMAAFWSSPALDMNSARSLRLIISKLVSRPLITKATQRPIPRPHGHSAVITSTPNFARSIKSSAMSQLSSAPNLSKEPTTTESAFDDELPIPSAPKAAYKYILSADQKKKGVGLITLNRPKQLNALNSQLITELDKALHDFDRDSDIGAIVITGSDRAFAAGADIGEMSELTFGKAFSTDFIEMWSYQTSQIKKPIIAAVNGFALGGGCELAMMADIIYCNSTATFGQPEVNLGTIPGAGGSQRLTRAIGKSKAMEIILTGKNFSGKEAGEWGLAAQVFDTPEQCLDGALRTAEIIASKSRIAVKAAKEVVNKSQDLGLREGVEYERRVFHGLFGSQDQKIGMKAFLDKNKNPVWSNE